MKRADTEVLAAGGVIVRQAPGGPQVALVHRPRYDDWSLPKGKLAPDESFEQAALREVAEETGIECELGDELSAARYTDQNGRSKLVRWWLMTPARGEFTPNDEVDDLRWCDASEAESLLDYPADRSLVREALAEEPGEATKA